MRKKRKRFASELFGGVVTLGLSRAACSEIPLNKGIPQEIGILEYLRTLRLYVFLFGRNGLNLSLSLPVSLSIRGSDASVFPSL